MSVTTAKQRLTTKTATPRACSRVPQVFQVAAHIVGFRVVHRVDLVLRVVNGVLVAVIVHSFCIPNSCIFHIAKTGLLEVLSLQLLETCLTVGLLPLMIILITASLSSNTYNKASWCEDWTFEGTQSMLLNTLIIP